MKWWIAARLSFDFISAYCNVLLHFLLLNVTFFQYPCIKTCFLNTPSFAVSHDINHLLCGIWLRSPDHFCLCFLGILNMDVTSKVWTWLKLLKMKPDISTLVLLALDRFPEVLSFGQIQLCRSAMFFFFLVRRHFLLAALSMKPYLACFFSNYVIMNFNI